MADNRPRGRKRNITGGGSGVNLRGSARGSSPVGAGGRAGGGRQRNVRGRSPIPLVILVILVLLFGGGSVGGLLGGGSDSYSDTQNSENTGGNYSPSAGDSNFNFYNSYYSGNGSLSTGWSGEDASQTTLNTDVASGSREKFTKIRGNGDDTVTIMVYLCGTDLESQSGMATSDLQEMASARLSRKINLLVYTGGCNNWYNNIVSSRMNQIYQVVDGGVKCLVRDAGTRSMTDPDNLASYIQWGAENFPADRYELILWDHGGGSVSGYGYDEKHKSSGSMSLSGIRQAMEEGGVKFDMVGFDACLMATAETALMLSNYADYMVASEETEPGVGWYYTDWLEALGVNSSLPTLEIGQKIVDSFVETCSRKCRGQKITLSVVDLAELSNTVPSLLNSFSKAVSSRISDKNYQQIAQARNQTREFASNTRIDQVDLVHLALNTGLKEGEELSEAVRSAVKYNRTSVNISNAYGLSIYFPYRSSAKYVDSVSNTYEEIGMDEDYRTCIRQFASLEVSGQAAGGGSGSAYNALFSDYAGQFTGAGSAETNELISTLLTEFLSGDYRSVSGMSSSGETFLSDGALSEEDTLQYLQEHHFDATKLAWVTEKGKEKIKLSEEQWNLVTDLELNTFYDTGDGYVDLGMDNVYEFDEEGNLLADDGEYWISINDQPVAYYHMDTLDDGTYYTITGRVPCMINNQRSDLVIVFDNDHEDGYVVGSMADYSADDEINVAGKQITELLPGDIIEPICDVYNYDGSFESSYYLGDPIKVENSAADLLISDTALGEGTTYVTYRFTDIYGANHWTQTLQR